MQKQWIICDTPRTAIASKLHYNQALKNVAFKKIKIRLSASFENGVAKHRNQNLKKLIENGGNLLDPRPVGRTHPSVIDILLLAVCAIFCRADDWESLEVFGNLGFRSNANIHCLKMAHQYRVFRTITPSCFTRCVFIACASWLKLIVASKNKVKHGSREHHLPASNRPTKLAR